MLSKLMSDMSYTERVSGIVDAVTDFARDCIAIALVLSYPIVGTIFK